MKHVPIVLAAIFALALSPPGVLAGAGDTQEFLCERDSWVSTSGGETNTNHGANTTGRGAKGWGLGNQENTSFFDWDMAPIETFITAQMPGGYYPVFTLSVMPATWDGRFGSLNLGVRTVDSVNDWAEGDGTSSSAFNWSPGTKAATANYAQHALDAGGIEDLPNSLGWGDGSQTFHQAAALTSTDPLVITGADVDNYASADLSYAVMQHMRDRATTNNRGLYLTNTVDSNWELYMREHATGGEAKLTVSFSDAPMDYTWTAGTGNWSNAGNWDLGVPPAGENAIVAPVLGSTVTVDADTAAINDLALGSTGTGVTLDGAFTLNIDGTLTSNAISGWQSGRQNTINCTLNGTAGIEVVYGKLFLTAANTISGPVNIAPIPGQYKPYLYAHSPGALGSGAVTVNDGGRLYNWFDESHGPLVVKAGGYALFAPDYNNQGARTASATTYLVDGGTLVGNFDIPAGASVTIDNDGVFGGASNGNWGRTFDIDATVTMLSDFTFRPGGHTYNGVNWNGQIVGNGHTITVIDADTNYSYSHGLDVHLTNAAQAFDGDWVIQQGVVYVEADGALGVGSSAVVDKQSRYAALMFRTEQTGTLPTLTAKNGGIIRLDDRDGGGAHEFAHDIHLETDGILQGRDDTYGAHANLTGDLYVDGESKLQTVGKYAGRKLEISGEIHGSAKLTTEADNNANPIILSGDNSATFSGDVEAAKGLLSVAAVGALGTGNAIAKGGIIRSDIDGAFDSPASVVADEGGTIDLNSTETAQIQILQMGGFKVSGGSTVLDYTPTTGNIQVHAGCVLDQSVGTGGGFPLAGDFLTGDGGYGAFLATDTGDWSVGAPSIFRGLALSPNASATYGGTITENTGSTSGIGMLAMTGATWTFDGATFNAQPGQDTKFYGAGNFVITGYNNTFSGDIENHSTGMVRVDDDYGINNKTLTMKAGYLEVNHEEALANATVNLEGGVYRQTMQTLQGTINVKAGGGVYLWGQWFEIYTDLAGGATFNFEPGSQLGFDGHSGFNAGALPTPDISAADGKADMLLFDDGRLMTTTYDFDLVMGDASRITYMPSAAGGMFGGTLGGAGKVVLAPDMVQTRVAAHSDAQYLNITRQIDLTGSGTATGTTGKLIVGDAATDYMAIAQDGTGTRQIAQDGTVHLRNDTNVIGSIDVQAGTLRTDNAGRVGGATSVHIAQNATWASTSALDLATVVSGTGTVQMPTLTLTPSGGTAAGVAPGDSAGTLNVAGNLTLGNDGVDFATLDIEVVSAAAVDKVAVTGNLDVAGGNLAVTMDVPSVNYKPADLTGLEIATCGGTLTGPFNAVTTSAFGAVGDAGVQAAVAAHWTIEADDVTYGSNNIVLDGSNWTGFTGDADLSDFVDLADLSILAFNWEKSTGMTWLTADFDLNGVVNLADLSALAFHWEQAPPAGAPPVPEPMTVGLLLVGGAALLRRRRR